MGAMGAVLGIIGGVVQGMGAMQAHEAEAKAHEYNVAVAERNKQVIHEQTAAAITDQTDANWRQLMSIEAIYAHNGLMMTGSASDVLREQTYENILGIQRISYKGRLAEIEQIDKANLETMGADASRQAGQISMISGILGGLTQGVSAFSRMA